MTVMKSYQQIRKVRKGGFGTEHSTFCLDVLTLDGVVQMAVKNVGLELNQFSCSLTRNDS